MAQTVEVIKVCPYADYAVVNWIGKEYEPYVACWCPRVKLGETESRKLTLGDSGETLNMYWGQGHYFTNLEDALAYALDREEEAFGREK